jgi:hypothetical protein
VVVEVAEEDVVKISSGRSQFTVWWWWWPTEDVSSWSPWVGMPRGFVMPAAEPVAKHASTCGQATPASAAVEELTSPDDQVEQGDRGPA